MSARTFARIPVRHALTACTAVLAALLPAHAAGAAVPEPDPTVPRFTQFAPAFAYTVLKPGAYPPDVNDWNCRPSPEHPRPVVLVHGTAANSLSSWSALAPVLRKEGYCAYAKHIGGKPNDPMQAMEAVDKTSKQLAAFVDEVLAKTRTKQVDMVGYSQGGGVLPRYYLKYDGGTDATDPSRNKVGKLIGISPSNHGTSATGFATLARMLNLINPVGKLLGQAIPDQTECSDLNAKLDEGGDTLPGVTYTNVTTVADNVVTPYTNQFLREKAAPDASLNQGRERCRGKKMPPLAPPVISKPEGGIVAPAAHSQITNILLQDVCPTDRSGHLRHPYSPTTIQLTLNALDPAHAKPAPCRIVLPVPLLG
ncbi:alpha/beta fold hydrolase [Streptomyces sp. NPDC050095]|uniref:esterase/lipase family protein n=1 Tax=unclassified Streptomyces TaxID=2593676 RepID=UPI003438FD4A